MNLVINWDLPQTTISYIHRIGRSGRAGRRGKAITFYTQDDHEYVASIGYIIKQSGCEVPEYVLGLKKPNKKKKKQLKVSAPKREQISTTPIYETVLKNKKKRYILNSKQKIKGKEGAEIAKKNPKLERLNKAKKEKLKRKTKAAKIPGPVSKKRINKLSVKNKFKPNKKTSKVKKK